MGRLKLAEVLPICKQFLGSSIPLPGLGEVLFALFVVDRVPEMCLKVPFAKED